MAVSPLLFTYYGEKSIINTLTFGVMCVLLKVSHVFLHTEVFL